MKKVNSTPGRVRIPSLMLCLSEILMCISTLLYASSHHFVLSFLSWLFSCAISLLLYLPLNVFVEFWVFSSITCMHFSLNLPLCFPLLSLACFPLLTCSLLLVYASSIFLLALLFPFFCSFPLSFSLFLLISAHGEIWGIFP